MKTVNSSSI